MEDFESFFARKLRERKKWAGENRLTAFRIYEREIPSHPFVVDLYGTHLHVSEVVKDQPKPEDWLVEFTRTLETLTGIPQNQIHIKSRLRQLGKSQYEKQQETGHTFPVTEGGLKFLVNLDDYLDTGLFLDHRISRALVGAQAEGKKFLNLFCYTGSFTVYACAGGAFETTSVDLSGPYLTWAEENLKVNGLEDPLRNKFVKKDVMEFLRNETKTYDLIVLDPPTFSNSKKMAETLDVQRDHLWLVDRCLKLLNPGGKLFFSNNYQKFRLDPEIYSKYKVEDLGSLTIPADFKKNCHHAWWISRDSKPAEGRR